MIKVLAIIPERKGSKGVPNKNKKVILGKPLISYTIEAALESSLLENIYVSSDDNDILKIAKNYNNIQLHNRKPNLALDNSLIGDTVYSIVSDLNIDAIMLLQPTAPIKTGKNIDDAITILNNDLNIDSVISVVEMNDVHPARMYWKEKNKLNPIMPKLTKLQRQDIPKAYYRNGSIYLIRKEAFMLKKSFFTNSVSPYIMPYNWLLNIDEQRDIIIAKSLISAWKENII